MTDHILGRNGEALAKQHLISQGYQYITSNYKTRYGEIDHIFKDGETLVFVEVKCRKGPQLMDIEATINQRKVKRILKSAEIYINNSEIKFEEMRIDAFFVEMKSKEPSFKHIKSFY